MLRSRVHSPAAVVVAALDLDDVGALLASPTARPASAGRGLGPRPPPRYRLQLHSSFQARRTAISPRRIHQWSRRGPAGGSAIGGTLSRSLERSRARPFRDGPFSMRVA